jgi:hypothetical protein
MIPIFVVFFILLGLILIVDNIRGESKILLGVLIILGIITLPYAMFTIISIIIVLPIPQLDGVCSDISEPKGAIEFAYEHMTTKENITFINIAPNDFESYCLRHYWVTDTEGTTYRLVWSKMHNEIELNKSYKIKYMGGSPFNALWEYKESLYLNNT